MIISADFLATEAACSVVVDLYVLNLISMGLHKFLIQIRFRTLAPFSQEESHVDTVYNFL